MELEEGIERPRSSTHSSDDAVQEYLQDEYIQGLLNFTEDPCKQYLYEEYNYTL